jgi:hypothetical protein
VLRILVDPVRPRRASTSTPLDRPPVAVAQAGSLHDRPLPRLLLELFEAQATGVLSLQRAQLRKQFFLLLGHPIGADSNLRSETLPELLRARGAVEPARLEEALALADKGRDRLGAILIERGWMKESEVMNYLAAQVRLKIVNALRWEGGDFRFQPGDTFSGRMTHLTVDAPRVVLAALKQSAHVDAVAQAALAQSGRLRLGPRFPRHREAFTAVFGDGHLPLLSDAPRPRELALRGDARLMAAYEALLLTGLGQLVPDESAGDTAAAGGAPGEAPAPAPANAPAAREVWNDVFGGDDVVDSDDVPLTPSLLAHPEDSGVFPLRHTTAAASAPADPAVAAAKGALLREYLEFDRRSYYDRLRVARDADAETIERAYAAREGELRAEASRRARPRPRPRAAPRDPGRAGRRPRRARRSGAPRRLRRRAAARRDAETDRRRRAPSRRGGIPRRAAAPPCRSGGGSPAAPRGGRAHRARPGRLPRAPRVGPLPRARPGRRSRRRRGRAGRARRRLRHRSRPRRRPRVRRPHRVRAR